MDTNKNNVLVCVTQQKTCERLIRKAVELLDEFEGTLYVLHVAKSNWKFLNHDKEGEALDYLFGISKSVGASLTVLRSDNIVDAIVQYAYDNNINCIVLGESPDRNSNNNIALVLKDRLKNVDIKVIS